MLELRQLRSKYVRHDRHAKDTQWLIDLKMPARAFCFETTSANAMCIRSLKASAQSGASLLAGRLGENLRAEWPEIFQPAFKEADEPAKPKAAAGRFDGPINDEVPF
jgi:hypothetical protein